MKYREVMPITRAYFEMGQFDTQVVAAVQAGKPLPTGLAYQHGPRYGYNSLRAAVFARDGHTCQVCGKGVKKGVILVVHHLGFSTGDHTDRMSNLLTVCTDCHTSKNHKPGGKLWDLKPKLPPFTVATFMTAVRWNMIKKLKEAAPEVEFHFSYGQATKEMREQMGIKKTHANDAYALGTFHPKWRGHTVGEASQEQPQAGEVLRREVRG